MAHLDPSQRRVLRRATRRATDPTGGDPSEQGSELNIVPLLDVVVNLMLFLLATSTATLAVTQVSAELEPTCTNCHGPDRRGLNLSVTLTESGAVVAGEGARLAPGCSETTTARGITVPTTAAGHDFDGLRDCLARVHARFPEEDSVILSADPQIPYDAIVHAMDAARGPEGDPWFPRVRLSAGVR
jgi:biopolymer transport protein TolR